MSLLRKFGIVGGATLASRLTGFARDALIAAVLGTTAVADAFFVAFLLPNLFRRMLGDGAFNAAFIPIFTRRESEEGPASARRFADNALTMLILVLAGLFALALAFMPALIGLLAGGFLDQAEKFADAVLFARIAFPFVVTVTLVALFSAVLNAIDRYAIAALAPVLLNILLAGALLVLMLIGAPSSRETGIVIVSVIAFAGLIQLLVMMLSAAFAGYGLRPRAPEASWFGPFAPGRNADPDIRRFALLALPGIAVAGAGHINILVAVQMASSWPSAVSWLYYADRFFQLPLGFVATAIGVVLLPSIARHVQAGDTEGMRDVTSRTLEFALLLALPAAAALYLLSEPLIGVLYQRGRFTASDTAATAAMLRALALGLPGFVLVKAFLPSFLARENFKYPILFALAGLLANVAATLWLAPVVGASAPAWGVTVSAWLNAGLLAFMLARRGDFALDGDAKRRLPRIVLAAGLTAALVLALRPLVAPFLLSEAGFALRLALLLMVCLAGIGAHGLLAWGLGATEVPLLRRFLSRERGVRGGE